MSLFGIDIASIVTDAFSGQLKPAVLKRTLPGSYNPITDTHTGDTPATFTTEGIVESYSDHMKASGLANENHRKIMVLAQPLGTVPKNGDRIEIEGKEYTVTGTPERDSVSATYVIKGEL